MASHFDKYYASWVNEIPKQMYDNISRRSPTMKMLMKNKKSWDQGGDTIQPAIEYAYASNAGSYRGYDTLNIEPQQTVTDAEFRRKQLYASIVYNGYEVASSRGKNAIFSMAEIAMNGAETALFNLMATQIFADGTGNGGKDILGLPAAVDDGTNVAIYGGIDRTTNTFWKAQYDDSIGSITNDILTQYYVAASRGGLQNSPDFMVAGFTAWQAVNKVVSGRYETHSTVNDAGKMFGNLGFPFINFMGVPVVYDEYCPTGDLYMLNSDTIQLWTDPVINFKPSELVKPPNMDAKIGQIFWSGELVCTQPRANVHLKGITGAA
ncbi:phage major capsid protein [Cohnella zeiphila]|uniref:Phage major capsid protein n=1 Tax=Cohnella zeiphila TaxID=2761120 RepID=A0A7X0VVX0_9BACL|nr:phage major capsid protein [Cohnella zeiphila]MBB6731890.1 phage major capsid protein [Cohnella zeiphila]